ncbi:MAG: hypothetical protein AAGI17_01910 [Planctomycetota bacterium]
MSAATYQTPAGTRNVRFTARRVRDLESEGIELWKMLEDVKTLGTATTILAALWHGCGAADTGATREQFEAELDDPNVLLDAVEALERGLVESFPSRAGRAALAIALNERAATAAKIEAAVSSGELSTTTPASSA